ncbi:hypothetical protein [Burkholderia ubonensis]|uniref:hypothetical protein n=1 Tax=Burkholderia ubonensis TaxID=101571 RepID=UPI0012F931B0|nr:hypothetical protein [Burkholderia ubonensis]
MESIPERFPDALLADAARISYADTHQTDATRRPPACKPAAACDSGDVPSCSRRRNKRPAFTHWDEHCKKPTKPKSTPNYRFDFQDSQGAFQIKSGACPGLLFQDETKRNSLSGSGYWH